MAMEAPNYWQPVCEVVHRLRCWVRLASVDGISPWGQLLTMPTTRHLEACWGPVPVQLVSWVQLMPVKVRGGLAGRPLEFSDLHDEVVAAIQQTPAIWSFREEEWSVERLFQSRLGVAIHLANPFKSGASQSAHEH